MKQLILDKALSPQHRQAGLKLTHPRPHLLCLETQAGSPISYFDSVSATIQQIHQTADVWMMETDQISYVGVK